MAYNSNKLINDLEAKATPVDADVLVVGDSADTNRAKKTTWAQIKTVLGSLFAPLTAPTFATSITTDYLTASEIVISDASKKIVSAPVATYPSLTELSYVKGATSALQTQITAKAPSTAPTFATSITGSYLTASELLGTGASKEIVSLPVATYPSLAELAYVKGVTSAIQTQLNAKTSKCILGRSTSLTGSATNLKYITITGSEATGVDTDTSGIPIPFAGTVKNLYARSGATLSSVSSTLTIRKNGADTTLTVQFTNNTNATIADTTHSFSVSAGDLLTASWYSSGTSDPILASMSIEIDPT